MIRTVLGDIEPSALGRCDAHEHLTLASPLLAGEELDTPVEDARVLAAAGVQAVVEWTPLGLGRDLDALRGASREAGIHIVASTGLHRDAHYPADHWARRETNLADLFER